MSIIKSEKDQALDAVSAGVDELLSELDILSSVESCDEEVIATLQSGSSEIESKLAKLGKARRAQGNLPAAGNTDKAHIIAAKVAATATLGPDDKEMAIADHLLDDVEELLAAMDDAQKEITMGENLRAALNELQNALSSWKKRLKALQASD